MKMLPTLAAVALSATAVDALYINGSVTAPCDSPLYCQGEILKAIELAQPFSDSKTFVDMPTKLPLDQVIANFQKLSKPVRNNTELHAFLLANFEPAGTELKPVPASQLKTNATFLNKIQDPAIREFSEAVIKIWPELTRNYESSVSCSGCVNSYIPVNRTFVVAGGRFREPYYWDSYWIAEGLVRTGGSFVQITKNIIENFLDFVEEIGFVPNGARIYYKNRSQPPLLTQMVRLYVEHTRDTSILKRALPLLIKEYEFWSNNRTVEVKGRSGKTYTLNRYHVDNNQPRPESYREDWITANNQSYHAQSGIIYPETVALNDSQKAILYSNLASGAESGWDYGTRWISRPHDAAADVYFPLRSLNTRELIPVDLNSILYWNEVTIAGFLRRTNKSAEADQWQKRAAARSDALYNVMWNATLWSFFDYNLTSSAQNIYVPADPDATTAEQSTAPEGQQVLFHVAQLFPFWTGAAPAHLKNNPLAVKRAYSRVADMLNRKGGAIPATNFFTGQQWDEPNVWPPLQHALMEGLLKTPPTFGKEDPDYIDVQNLALRLGQRYLDSTFCTWRSTGGATSVTPKLAGLDETANGIMFEKYSDNSTNAAGAGGEYEVVEGFGWTNGVLLWTADTFAGKLTRPECPNLTAANVHDKSKRSFGKRAVELDRWDAKWIKTWKK
ncbi:glycoside hydrolase family 37 protein [Rhypophila sp. PSN 637]